MSIDIQDRICAIVGRHIVIPFSNRIKQVCLLLLVLAAATADVVIHLKFVARSLMALSHLEASIIRAAVQASSVMVASLEKINPAFGNAADHRDGHGGFAVRGGAIWGDDVIAWVNQVLAR